MSNIALYQEYWWLIVSLLGGLLLFMSFIQGGQTLLGELSSNYLQRDLIVNTLGRKWEIGFSTLVLFGGALFAAFPLFYSVSFGGAYYLWMMILFCYIIQAVSYEYRNKSGNVYGRGFFDMLLFINGSLGIFLIGVAVGSMFSGGYFTVNSYNLSHWESNLFGLEALSNPFNITLGLFVVAQARLLALHYFLNAIDDHNIALKIKAKLPLASILYVALLGAFLYQLLLLKLYYFDGTHFLPQGAVDRFLHYPIVLLFFIIGAILIISGIITAFTHQATRAIFFSGLGVVLAITALLELLGIGNGAIYPSISHIEHSLYIGNASGSLYTLEVMSAVSLMVPFVLGYIIMVWRAMNQTPLSSQEVQNDHHHY